MMMIRLSRATFDFDGESADEGGAADLGSTPASQSLVTSTVYDAWGNAVASCAGADLEGAMPSTSTPTEGCLRFGHVDYDEDYRQLAVAEHLAVGRDASSLSYLTHLGEWDRGLGALVRAEDPNELETVVTYDGLGRLTSSTPPAVAGCSAGHVATHIRYELTTSPASQPLSRVITTTELACDGTLGESGDTLVSIAYVDGLGRMRATLATGDEDNAWVRSGITTLDKKGTVRRTYQTDFYDLSDTAFASVVALSPSTPYTVNRHDAFGRVMGVHAEDGSVTWTSFHALSTDVCDPLDNDPGSVHYQTCTTVRTDGHGRVIDQVLRNRDPDTLDLVQYRLWTYYRADGAVLALVRAESDGARPASWTSGLPSRHVVRTFTYDTPELDAPRARPRCTRAPRTRSDTPGTASIGPPHPGSGSPGGTSPSPTRAALP
ncbi:MAG: hypothetical protein M5U28_05350 [Sandaracinaceae bacterium]|nr:hypothetical protein [Sandaracinaceae bacterium]